MAVQCGELVRSRHPRGWLRQLGTNHSYPIAEAMTRLVGGGSVWPGVGPPSDPRNIRALRCAKIVGPIREASPTIPAPAISPTAVERRHTLTVGSPSAIRR